MLPGWRRMFMPGVMGLMVAHLVGYLLGLIAPALAATLLGLWVGPGWPLRFWQLITYPFPSGALEMLGSVLVLIFLGSAVERIWKTGPLLMLWALATVGCGVLCGLLGETGTMVAGGNGASLALLVVWGHLHRNRRLAMPPVQALTLVWLVIVLYALISLSRPQNMIWLFGAVIGWFYLRVLSRMEDRRAADLGSELRSRKGVVDID